MSSDGDTGTRDGAPRRRRVWRFLVRTTALVLVFGAGWTAGLKTHGPVDVDRLASAASTTMADVGAFLGAAGRSALAKLQDQPAGEATEPGATLAAAGVTSAVGGGERADLKLQEPHEVQAPSEAAVEALRGTIDRVASSVDGNQRQLVAKLEEFNDRLQRLERHGSDAAKPISARLELLNERLERMERSAPATLASAQPSAAASKAYLPAPNPQTSEKPQASAEPKKIADWVVREVVNGIAILQGRGGVVGVSVGDLVPGVGRVQSIARHGGRWVVATNKGVITAR